MVILVVVAFVVTVMRKAVKDVTHNTMLDDLVVVPVLILEVVMNEAQNSAVSPQ